MRTYKGEVERESKSKLREFAFKSMKKAKEGLMIVTFSVALATGFTNNVYGDEKMSDNEGTQVYAPKPKQKQQMPQVPQKLTVDEKWYHGAYCLSKLFEEFNLNPISKKDFSLDEFKKFLDDKKPSEIIGNSREKYLKMGLTDAHVNRIIEIATKFDEKFGNDKKINMQNQDGTTMAFIMYFTLIGGEDYGSENIMNTKNIRFNFQFTKKNTEIDDLNGYASAIHVNNKFKRDPQAFKQVYEEDSLPQIYETDDVVVNQKPESVGFNRTIDVTNFSADPSKAVEKVLGEGHGTIDVGSLTSDEYRELHTEAMKRKGKREANLATPNLTEEQRNADQGELDSLNQFIKELEEKREKSKKIKDGKVYGGQFGGGISFSSQLQLYNDINWGLALLYGASADVIANWDEINKAKFNTLSLGGYLGLGGTLYEVAKDTNVYGQFTIGFGMGSGTEFLIQTPEFSASFSQVLGVNYNSWNIYLTGDQIIAKENLYLLGLGVTSPIGVGGRAQFDPKNKEFNPYFYYESPFIADVISLEVGIGTSVPLDSEYLPNARLNLGVFFPAGEFGKFGLNLFCSFDKMPVTSGENKEGFNRDSTGFSGFKM